MTQTEQKIITLIQDNPFIAEDLKKRYILALFLMDSKKQDEYLELWQAFDSRCKNIQAGQFKLEPGDVKNILRSVDEVKRELISKIKSSNQP